MTADLPQRRHPVHGLRPAPNMPVVVFLTICTRGRVSCLANDYCHETLRHVWQSATAWRVGPYIIMPDHIHLFAVPGEPELDLGRWVRFWKSQVTRASGDPTLRWQLDYWDTRMRSRAAYAAKLDYAYHNPVRHRLVARAEDWPYRGEVFPVEW